MIGKVTVRSSVPAIAFHWQGKKQLVQVADFKNTTIQQALATTTGSRPTVFVYVRLSPSLGSSLWRVKAARGRPGFDLLVEYQQVLPEELP